MSETTSHAYGRRSIRAFVEHVTRTKSRMPGLFRSHDRNARARTARIGMADLAYNLTRFVWHQGRTAPTCDGAGGKRRQAATLKSARSSSATIETTISAAFHAAPALIASLPGIETMVVRRPQMHPEKGERRVWRGVDEMAVDGILVCRELQVLAATGQP